MLWLASLPLQNRTMVHAFHGAGVPEEPGGAISMDLERRFDRRVARVAPELPQSCPKSTVGRMTAAIQLRRCGAAAEPSQRRHSRVSHCGAAAAHYH